MLGIFLTNRARLPIVPPAATKFSAARCLINPSNCHGLSITAPSAGNPAGNPGVPNKLNKCVINVENAPLSDAASKCFCPGGGL
jgi:hypothetical protein